MCRCTGASRCGCPILCCGGCGWSSLRVHALLLLFSFLLLCSSGHDNAGPWQRVFSDKIAHPRTPLPSASSLSSFAMPRRTESGGVDMDFQLPEASSLLDVDGLFEGRSRASFTVGLDVFGTDPHGGDSPHMSPSRGGEPGLPPIPRSAAAAAFSFNPAGRSLLMAPPPPPLPSQGHPKRSPGMSPVGSPTDGPPTTSVPVLTTPPLLPAEPVRRGSSASATTVGVVVSADESTTGIAVSVSPIRFDDVVGTDAVPAVLLSPTLTSAPDAVLDVSPVYTNAPTMFGAPSPARRSPDDQLGDVHSNAHVNSGAARDRSGTTHSGGFGGGPAGDDDGADSVDVPIRVRDRTATSTGRSDSFVSGLSGDSPTLGLDLATGPPVTGSHHVRTTSATQRMKGIFDESLLATEAALGGTSPAASSGVLSHGFRCRHS